MDLNSIFLYVFIGTLAVLVFKLFLGDMVDEVLNIDNDYFNVTTLLCFVGLTSAGGYLLTKYFDFTTPLVFIICCSISFILTICLNMFVFIPLSNMESTTAIRIEALKGELGEVTLRIPSDSIGEVMVRTPLGNVSRTAKSYSGKEIQQGDQVLVMYVEDNVFYVEKYDPDFKVKI